MQIKENILDEYDSRVNHRHCSALEELPIFNTSTQNLIKCVKREGWFSRRETSRKRERARMERNEADIPQPKKRGVTNVQFLKTSIITPHRGWGDCLILRGGFLRRSLRRTVLSPYDEVNELTSGFTLWVHRCKQTVKSIRVLVTVQILVLKTRIPQFWLSKKKKKK